MKYIIMCGGKYPEFDTPRWCLEVFGEPLVARTIRLLKEAGVEDIAISTQCAQLKRFGVPLLSHDNGFVVDDRDTFWVDAFYPMDEPVCYIFGDVFFSPQAIQTIVNYTVDDVMFFAHGIGVYTYNYIKDWGEPFAFKVMDTDYFKKCIEMTKEYDRQGLWQRMPVSWELWQVIRGTKLNQIVRNYAEINDYTCDVDHKEDIEHIQLMVSPDVI